jgi:hypothetical protein
MINLVDIIKVKYNNHRRTNTHDCTYMRDLQMVKLEKQRLHGSSQHLGRGRSEQAIS